MADQVTVRELSRNLSRYLDQVSRGASVVVTRNGRAIAAVVPASADGVPVAAYVRGDDWT